MTQLWTSADLAAATQGQPSAAFAASGISIDTRTLAPGDLFIALRGTTDGHAHLAAAFAKGAAAALVDHAPDGITAPLLTVPDTTIALTAIGRAARARFPGPVIAVTGSVGKTTTKDMLRLALSDRGAAHAAEASHNNHLGVPLTLARLPPTAPACIVEIGMNHPGEIAPLALLTAPTVAVITTIGSAHIGQMGSLAAIAAEKATIADGLTGSGIAVLPADSPHFAQLAARAAPHRVLSYGFAATADCRLTAFIPDAEASTITATIAGRTHRFRLPAPGRHMALNALATLAATHAAGLDVARAAAALEHFTPGAGRGAQRRLDLPDGPAILLDESYNASAASIRAALEVLALIPARRRLVALGDMRELGTHSAAEHAALAAPVAGVADLLFTCGPDMRHLYDAAPPAIRAAHADTAAALAPLLAATLRPGDAVLVKGSNASRMRDVIAALTALAQATV